MRAELTSRACRAFAAGFHELRDDWTEEGISAALWLRRGQDPFITIAAMCKAAANRNNDTPSAVDFTSSQGPMVNTCRDHPLAGIRQDGQCAGCWSESVGSDEPLPLEPKSSRSAVDRARLRQIASGGTQ